MKKYLVTLLIIITSLCILACGGDSKKSSGDDNKKSSTTTSQQTSAQNSKFKNQDLSKIIPIAKAIRANENELREVEKILSSLDIDFNNIGEFKGEGRVNSDVLAPAKGEVRKLLMGYTSGKKEFLIKDYNTSVVFRLYFDDKKLYSVKLEMPFDNIYLYHDGITYHKMSDFILTDEVRNKIKKNALQQIQNSEFGKKFSNIQLVSNKDYYKIHVYAKTYAEGYSEETGFGNTIYRTKYLRQIGQLKWYKDIKTTPYIYAGFSAKAKEKYYGGENDISITMNAFYDMQGNYVTAEKFGEYTSSDYGVTYIEASGSTGGRINLGQVVSMESIRKDPYASVIVEQTKNNDQQQKQSDQVNESFTKSEGLITGDDVNVREGPGVNYKSLGVFFKGDRVRVVDINSSAKETWYKIEYDNPKAGLITGWVRSDYIGTSVSVPPISTTAITDVKHSSALNDNGYIYSGKLTLDGDLSTCWAEGVPGLGIGESITYFFDKNYLINGVTICPGHQKSPDLYEKNARPKFIRLISSNGYKEDCIFKNFEYSQTITFTYPIIAKSIKLVIEDVIHGDKYEDTCIAEVKFF